MSSWVIGKVMVLLICVQNVLIVFQSAVAPAASTSVISRAGWLALRRSTALVIRDGLSLVVMV